MVKKGWLIAWFFTGVFLSYPVIASTSESRLYPIFNSPLEQLKKIYQEKDYRAVVREGEAHFRQGEKVPDIRYFTGLAYYQLKDYDRAIAVLKPALAAYPDYLDVRLLMVRSYRAKKNTAAAYALVVDGVSRHADNVALLYQKASLEIMQNKQTQAQQTLRDLLKIKTDYEPALHLQKQLIPETASESARLTAEGLPETEAAFLSWYQRQQYERLIEEGTRYLKTHPHAVDVRYYLGLSYYQQKKYRQSREQLQLILKSHPEYLEVREALIATLFAMREDVLAGEVITQGLQKHPEHLPLWMAKAKLSILHKDYKAARQQIARILVMDKAYQPALELQKNLSVLEREALPRTPDRTALLPKVSTAQPPSFPRYVFSAGTSLMDVTLPDQYWNFSSVSLYREDENISYGLIMNYARRLGLQATQGGIAILPRINRDTWFSTAYSYANKPALFADHTVYGEMFQNLFGVFTVSAGNEYRKIAKTYFNTYTASMTTYVGAYSFAFRPFIYRTKSGPNSILYRLSLQYDFDTPEQYIELSYSTGYSPDLFDLTTVDFFRVHEQIIMVRTQIKLNQALLLQLGGGYQNQKFLNQRQREIAYLNFGMKYRFDDV
ncbi:MAG: YaiO family outer membrane beta-barrel protein [Legionellaceae bacterium]|nr:YaiO family outer membrane beta-barrel protein [Legionellaceae bacterium]